MLQDILKFRSMLKDQQQYLERTSHLTSSPRANEEMQASAADTLKGVLAQLDVIIAKHLVENNIYLPTTETMIKREQKRRESLYLWGMM